MPAVEDYFSSLDASARAAFEHIRDLVMEMAPEAEQGTSYGMAALRYNQKPLLAFRAARLLTAADNLSVAWCRITSSVH